MPGCGILVATLRSFTWGLLSAPTVGILAFTMIPHSGTLLLEGEGYILATIFALLIPIRIVQASLGGTPITRFLRAILLNIQASFWVALVLAAAALYEAAEVIAMHEVSHVLRLNRQPENSDGEIIVEIGPDRLSR